MLTRLKKDVLKNKQLVSNLNRKMFLGYTKLKNSLRKKRNEIYRIYDPKKEYLPFEYEYQTMYKEKYLKKLNIPILLDLSVFNYSENAKKEEKPNLNKFLITEHLTTIRNKQNKITLSDLNKTLTTNRNILKRIFETEEEKNICYDLPFFSLQKKNNNNNRYINKQDFLYKISHNNIDDSNNISKAISVYNSSLFKTKYKEKSANMELSIKNPELKLKVKNLTPMHLKIPIINTKEKHLKLLSNQISLLKSIPNNIIKNFNDMINNVESEEEEYEYIKSKKLDDNSNYSIGDSENFNIKKFDNQKKINHERASTYNSFNNSSTVKAKIKKKYRPNYYSLQQLINKNKKYENIHKEAFKEFQSKINLQKDYKRKLNYDTGLEDYRPLTLGIVEPSKSLFKTTKETHKKSYLHESKIRDIIISKKLRCEFDSDDIKRILNGKKPMKDFKNIRNNYFHNEMINEKINESINEKMNELN